MIVNATPVGMYPDIDALPDIPYSLLGSDNLCFDLIYNPERTRFRGVRGKIRCRCLQWSGDVAPAGFGLMEDMEHS